MLIKDLPIEIQVIVFQRQEEQGNKPDANLDLEFCKYEDNFNWYTTSEGHDFWEKINEGNYSEFYKKYPKKEESKSLVGRYLKILVDGAHGTNYKKDDYVKIVMDNGFNVVCDRGYNFNYNWKSCNVELMPENFIPPANTPNVEPVNTEFKKDMETKFKPGDKVKIINRHPNNNTGSPPFDKQSGMIAFVCEYSDIHYILHLNKDGSGDYYGLLDIKNQSNYVFRDSDLELITEEPRINTYGLKIGDKLPKNVICEWANQGLNYCGPSKKWEKQSGSFVLDRTIKSFKVIDGVVGFEVSGTKSSVYLKAEGFKEFMDNFDKPKTVIQMNPYPTDIKYFKAKVVKDIVKTNISTKGQLPNLIPKGYETWFIEDYRQHFNNEKTAVHPESNRWEANIPAEYFEIIEDEIPKKVDMLEIQEECKKRFPIGCRYISTDGSLEPALLKDDWVYSICDNKIWAHRGGGCLYNNGIYATQKSNPVSESKMVEKIDFKGIHYDCLKKGEVYFIELRKYEHLFKLDTIKFIDDDSESYYELYTDSEINLTDSEFSESILDPIYSYDIKSIRLATKDEKKWFITCKRENKYIEKSVAIQKYDSYNNVEIYETTIELDEEFLNLENKFKETIKNKNQSFKIKTKNSLLDTSIEKVPTITTELKQKSKTIKF